MLNPLSPGDRIPAETINTLISGYNKAEVFSAPTSESALLYGVSPSTVVPYSVFGLYNGETQTNTEVPLVKIDQIGSTKAAFPFAMCTNTHFEATADKRCPIELLCSGRPYKFDVPTGDSGFVVGRPCGPLALSNQIHSGGVGFICLAEPRTYKATRKFIWAAPMPSPNLVAKIGDDVDVDAGTDTDPGSVTVTVRAIESSLLTNDDFTLTAYNIGPAIEGDTPGKTVMLVPVFGVGYVIVNSGNAGIIDLRVDGYELQYTKDGTNWTTWHEGEPCE